LSIICLNQIMCEQHGFYVFSSSHNSSLIISFVNRVLCVFIIPEFLQVTTLNTRWTATCWRTSGGGRTLSPRTRPCSGLFRQWATSPCRTRSESWECRGMVLLHTLYRKFPPSITFWRPGHVSNFSSRYTRIILVSYMYGGESRV
jgi:hypothetical protein